MPANLPAGFDKKSLISIASSAPAVDDLVALICSTAELRPAEAG
jgi:hypothetical protein